MNRPYRGFLGSPHTFPNVTGHPNRSDQCIELEESKIGESEYRERARIQIQHLGSILHRYRHRYCPCGRCKRQGSGRCRANDVLRDLSICRNQLRLSKIKAKIPSQRIILQSSVLTSNAIAKSQKCERRRPCECSHNDCRRRFGRTGRLDAAGRALRHTRLRNYRVFNRAFHLHVAHSKHPRKQGATQIAVLLILGLTHVTTPIAPLPLHRRNANPPGAPAETPLSRPESCRSRCRTRWS